MKKIFILLCLGINLCLANGLSKQSSNIGGHQLNYYKVGKGDPIVLIIGYGLTNNFWPRPFINCLSQNHTVYILDYIVPDKPDMNLLVDEIKMFINQQNLNHPEVIGWSMGGGIALSLASKYPHSVSKLGLISSIVAEPSVSQIVPPYESATSSTDEMLNYVFGNNIYKYTPKDLAKYKQQMLSEKVFVDTNTLDLQKSILANWMSDPDNSVMVSHIKVPANVIIAQHDAILNPQVELDAFKQYPKAQITVIDGGHAPFYRRPQQVCKAVLN